jgi:hypothetical protein
MRTIAWMCALGVVAVGCGNKSGSGGAPSASGSAASAAAEVKGLASPKNDPRVVELAKKALACKWNTDDLDFDSHCDDWQSWSSSTILQNGGVDETLVNMIEDTDPKVRALAAIQFGHGDAKYADDPALAARVLTAAEGEKTKTYGAVDYLGRAVGQIHHKKAGTWDRAKALAKASPLVDLRRGLAATLAPSNKDDPQAWDFAKDLLKDPSGDVRRAAMWAFGDVSGRRPDACGLFASFIADANVGIDAATQIAQEGMHCTVDQIEALLKVAEGRAKAGTLDDKSRDYVGGVRYASSNRNTTDAVRKHALAVARAVVENTKNGEFARSDALGAIGDNDKAGAKAFAAKFVKDKSSFVASGAKRIMGQK